MQLIYEGKDITNVVEIRKADLTDNAGGELDSIELHLNDTKGLWSQWKPEKNHAIQVKESGFDTGIMYIDEIVQQRGLIKLKALPIKQEAKTENTKAWEQVRFLEIVQEFAFKHGLTVHTYGMQDQVYDRVDQTSLSDPDFLALRCLLEGYSLKISDQKLIIYSEKYMETQPIARTLYPADFDGDFSFKNKSNQIFGACFVANASRNIEYEYKASGTYGPTFKALDLPLFSHGEAERFSKGILRSKNKYEKIFTGVVRLDPGIAAANTLELKTFGMASGLYLAFQVIHKFVEKKTALRLRKPLDY